MTSDRNIEPTSPSPDSKDGDAFKVEKFLRDEIRHEADVILKIVQWGITVETAVLSLIFYARRDIRTDLATHVLPNGLLPWRVHLVGTFFLLMIAAMFTILLLLVQRRRMFYREKLYKLPDHLIGEMKPTKFSSWIYPLMFLMFPLFDFVVRWGNEYFPIN
jgi:hypothetical protein